ncbi:MAG: PDZ domain-containing protein [Candidatus Peribacteria bacterium]|nr:PDZ domain-containing protein [Candidatus Peribacteria bacterium]
MGSGVVVKDITPNSLAEEIGLQMGNIILAVNGEEATIDNLSDLLAKGTYGKNTLTLQGIEDNEELPFSCGEDCKL